MSNTLSQIEFENARAEIFCFDNGTEVREYHTMIHVSWTVSFGKYGIVYLLLFFIS